MKRAAIVYWSKTGNTEKVAHAIKESLEEAGVKVTITKPEDAEDLDFFGYDLVCIGFPSYQWHPPKPMAEFLDRFAKDEFSGKLAAAFPVILPCTCVSNAAKWIEKKLEKLGFKIVAAPLVTYIEGTRENF